MKAPGKFAFDRVEQSSRAPPKRVAGEDAGVARSVPAATALGEGVLDDPFEKASATATAATAVAITIAKPIRVLMHQRYARGDPAVPRQEERDLAPARPAAGSEFTRTAPKRIRRAKGRWRLVTIPIVKGARLAPSLPTHIQVIECEHAFVSIKGSSYSRFRRSLATGRLSVVLLAAAELPQLALEDALEVLVLMAREHDPRFDRAATRWVGRLLAERPLGLADARFAIALVERLPAGVEALRAFARRR